MLSFFWKWITCSWWWFRSLEIKFRFRKISYSIWNRFTCS